MAYFKTEYDPKSMTVSVDDEEVTRALGILGGQDSGGAQGGSKHYGARL